MNFQNVLDVNCEDVYNLTACEFHLEQNLCNDDEWRVVMEQNCSRTCGFCHGNICSVSSKASYCSAFSTSLLRYIIARHMVRELHKCTSFENAIL